MISIEDFVKARKDAGLDQHEASRLFGVSQTSVSNLERGETKTIKPVFYRLLIAFPYLPKSMRDYYISR